MAEVVIDAVPQKVRDLFNKGFSALERGRLDYAIDMLSECLIDVPQFLQARRFLRAAEMQLYKANCGSSVSRIAALASTLPLYPVALLKMYKGGLPAVNAVDKLLRKAPLFKPYMLMFAHAAESADMPEAAVQMLEIGREHHVDDAQILEGLGEAYVKGERHKDAIACYERVCELRPNDPAALKLLKDAMALDSLSSDWSQAGEEGGSFQDLVRDSDEAKRLEKESKAVKSEADINLLIDDTLKRIEAEPENTNYYRSLSRLYAQIHSFDDAENTLKKAIELAPGDPEIENALMNVRVQRFDAQIKELDAQGDAEAATAMRGERDQFVFDDLQDRVHRYPNDLMLRYKLGVIMYENKYITEAIQQFQLAQRNAKNRTRALYYLGMCFNVKGQFDLAAQQLQTAASELSVMDGTKKDILYAMGEIAEKTGDTVSALEYFKQIYQVDIQFRDVAQKVEKGYGK
ncbi:MAG: tetratricopeptide repeat protein [Kiritimatiellae bacterium]|nr:tetratricopeptide repeat protein [Kiritimatiellia bacterium]